jgi:hypothetical protein
MEFLCGLWIVFAKVLELPSFLDPIGEVLDHLFLGDIENF